MNGLMVTQGPWRVAIGPEDEHALITNGRWLSWSNPLHDEVDSSATAFRLAGQLLAAVVGTLRGGVPVSEAIVMKIMATW